MEITSTENRNYTLITAYVNGTIRSKDKEKVEAKIGESESLQDFYKKKVQEREFLLQLIPNPKSNQNSLKNLKNEIYSITSEVFPKEKKSFGKDLKKMLNKSLFTVEF